MENTEKEKATGSSMNRRSFLAKLWIAFGVLSIAEIAWVVVAFLRPRSAAAKRPGADDVIEAGPVASFELGTVTAFPRGRFYLARLEDGGFLALSCKCTHLGCSVPWVQAQNRFICPCHSSTFDIAGNVVTAPAPRPLDLYRIIIENDVVKVDTRRCMRRNAFRKDQVVYPNEI